ncbi:MAG: SDR family oxidoreductase [Planctomycetes bacterium]|nr:SDR family oxidoreductase [Planctomycetota bacterium]
MANKKLQGRRALVTGASSGIGLEIARELARQGANLVVVARRTDRLEALATELREREGIEVLVQTADLADPSAPEALFAATEGAGVEIDLLVNNAGFGAYLPFSDTSWERYEGMIRVNMTSLTHLCWLFLPNMKARRRGWIMNVASMGAYLPCPTFAVYAASKAYVRNVTEAIDFELKGTGVHAISICPGGTTTEFLDHANQRLKPGASLAMMSAERCAKISVRKMLAGRRNVVTGYLNSFLMFALRFFPRGMYAFFGHVSLALGVESVPVKPAIATGEAE